MQLLQLKLLLPLLLFALHIDRLDFTDERLHVVLEMLNLVLLLAELQIRVQQQLEEGPDAGARSFKSLHVRKHHRVDPHRPDLDQLLAALRDFGVNESLLFLVGLHILSNSADLVLDLLDILLALIDFVVAGALRSQL